MLTFTDVIQPAQIKQHLIRPFQVPVGVRQLDITFEYEPHQVDGRNNLLTLTLFDTRGVRGEGHKMEPQQTITISPAIATPGYLAGVLPDGEWNIAINTHMVLAPVTYRLQIQFSTQETTTTRIHNPPGRTARRGPGWYRGDLHGHTVHSDAYWDVPDLVAYARSERLDFITLTDHNTVSGLAQMDSLSADDLLTMGGMELTTYHGHALALGIRDWVDWRVQAGGRTIPAICEEIKRVGGLFVIAHPMAVGDPICTGCDWQYPDVMPGPARCVEIWNSPWNDESVRSEMALQRWYQWLNAGHRMVATAGSDIHHAPTLDTVYGRDVVFAHELSERAILDGVRRGHLYLSAGPQLEFSATTADGQTAVMGDYVRSDEALLAVRWADAPAGTWLRWIVNGERVYNSLCDRRGSAELQLIKRSWAVVELRDHHDNMLAISNPIFLGDGWQ